MASQAYNPLALAVMALLTEKPMHPYEVAFTMQQRRLEQSIKLNYGSLYHTVEILHRSGLIESSAAEREGRRPERTVYALTDAGKAQFLSQLRQLVREPTREYSRFEAALCFLSNLPPAEAADLLEQRASDMEVELELQRQVLEELLAAGLGRLPLIEGECLVARLQSSLTWVRQLIADIRSGALAWQVSEVPRAVDRERLAQLHTLVPGIGAAGETRAQ